MSAGRMVFYFASLFSACSRPPGIPGVEASDASVGTTPPPLATVAATHVTPIFPEYLVNEASPLDAGGSSRVAAFACNHPVAMRDICVRPASPHRIHGHVRGTPIAEDAVQLLEGDEIVIYSLPEGCNSSSLAIVSAPLELVRSGPASWYASGHFCFRSRHHDAMLADCGHHMATTSIGKLHAGRYEVTSGDLALRFTLPSLIPVEGLCASTLATFDRTSAARALRDVDLSACKKPSGPAGDGHVTITFGSDGHVLSTIVDDGAFRHSAVGGCIAGKFRAMRVPPFSGSIIVEASFSL